MNTDGTGFSDVLRSAPVYARNYSPGVPMAMTSGLGVQENQDHIEDKEAPDCINMSYPVCDAWPLPSYVTASARHHPQTSFAR